MLSVRSKGLKLPALTSALYGLDSMIVHGIPGPYKLERGDIISIDIGVVYEGWVADAARTFAVEEFAPALDVCRLCRGDAVEPEEQECNGAHHPVPSCSPTR